MDTILVTVVILAVTEFVFVINLYQTNQQLGRENDTLRKANAAPLTDRVIPPIIAPVPRKSAEEQQDERLEKQLEAVTRETVTFSKGRVMGRGEYDLFRVAMTITRQPFPKGSYPFHVFPQVSLGQIIHTAAPWEWHAEQAHRAINSKRCDLLIADRNGNPIAVLEYQGEAHNLGGTAERRDKIKRIALEKAGIRFMEIRADATQPEMQQTIRDLLTPTTAA